VGMGALNGEVSEDEKLAKERKITKTTC
jgi:hypothetical protein